MSVFEGSMVALITPFQRGNPLNTPPIDETVLRDLVEWHIAEGTDAIVPCGTTGESATLNYEEHDRVIHIVVEQVKKRIPVLAGTGANSTLEAVQMTQRAKELGIDGSLQVCPYYNKPSQEGLFLHFKTIAESVDVPIVLYNVPGRTSVNLLSETVARLSRIKNIVGIKEACGDLDQIKKTRDLCGTDFSIFSGEDAQNYDILELGGRGTISVTVNVVPKTLARMWDLFSSGKKEEARKIHESLQSLHEAMFFETNPIPVKTALGMMGKCWEGMRLPLCTMLETNRKKLKITLESYQLV